MRSKVFLIQASWASWIQWRCQLWGGWQKYDLRKVKWTVSESLDWNEKNPYDVIKERRRRKQTSKKEMGE